jgi:hypothetical protein
MASEPSARNPGPSVSTSSTWRAVMQRSGESIALAAALAKAQAELTNPQMYNAGLPKPAVIKINRKKMRAIGSEHHGPRSSQIVRGIGW